MRLMRIVDVIPKSDSNEQTNDTETNIAVNPNNPSEIVVTSFSAPDPAHPAIAPFFYSTDSGENWTLEYDIPAGPLGASARITNDWTVAYGSTSNVLYTALLRADDESLNVLRGSDPSNPASFALLPTVLSDQPDNPWVTATTTSQGPDAGKDRVYIGYNGNVVPGATVYMCLDALASPAVFTAVKLEKRSGRSTLPQVRPTIHLDGTVYVAFQSKRSVAVRPTDVVVARDDNWGRNGFTDLRDPSDNIAGRIVASITEDTTEGDERGEENGLSIEVDPSNSDVVYVCYVDTTTTKNTVAVRRSLNRGKDWSGDLITVTDVELSILAINSKGVVALLFEKYAAGAPDKWETHFRTTEDGSVWDDTLLANADDSDPGNQFSLGDFMRMVAIGPHFYGAFPATNIPGPNIFFPNGEGTVKFLRNIAADGVTLVKTDGVTPLSTTPGPPWPVDPFFKVEQRDVVFQLNRNPISQDEVDARRQSGQSWTTDAFRVIVDGYTADELGVHGPGGLLNVAPPIASMDVRCSGNVPETGTWGKGFQRFTFTYDISFPDDSAFNFAGESQDVLLSVTAGAGLISVPASAILTLIKLPDPFILHGDTPWLSIDLRVFSVYAGQPAFSGSPLTVGDAEGCPGYIQQLMNSITVDQFNTGLTTDEKGSALYTQQTDGLGHDVFNFALAKVHYIGVNPNPFDVRVFFRLFQAQAASSVYDYVAGMAEAQPARFRRGTNQSNDPIPLAGFQGGEYVTIPFFATKRVLNINQPFRTDPSSGLTAQNNVLSIQVPANVDGPFTTGAVPIQSVIRDLHQCLVAEIDYTPTPIPVGATPSNWDKLAQRNIAFSAAGSATAVTTFEIKPTLFDPDQAQLSPDEIVIDWGSTRADVPAQIYLPTLQVSDILALAARSYYPTDRLSRKDDHTLSCRVGGIAYIPIPPTTATAAVAGDIAYHAALISIEMPDTLHKGEVFDIVVRQVTNRARLRPVVPALHVSQPPQHLLSAAATPSADNANTRDIIWREPSGAFQLTIPVGDNATLLPRAENDYAVLQYIARSIPKSSRWYLVFKRYLKIMAGRVEAFGGDPAEVSPSATGVGVGGPNTGGGCCPCCEERHHPECHRFKGCERHGRERPRM